MIQPPVIRPSRAPRRAAALLWLLLCGLLARPAWADQTATACPQSGAAIRLLVTAVHAHSNSGNVTFALYGENPGRFLAHHGAIALLRAPISAGTSTTCFAVATPGTYAIAIYHDENNNHHFDRTLIGLPAEGYGFSNNAPALVGLPAFADVRFTAAPGDTVLSIRLRY